jgi:hypothetical protein
MEQASKPNVPAETEPAAITTRISTRELRERQSIEAITARVHEYHSRRALRARAAVLAGDEEAFARQQAEQANETPSRQQARALARQGRQLAQRRLLLLQRDDEAVREILRRERRLTGIMPADSATDADELMWLVVERLGLLEALATLRPAQMRYDAKKGEPVRRRMMYSPLLLNLLGVLSRFLGFASGPDITAALLTDEAWMSLLGFNVAQVREGATRRSNSLSGKTREGEGGKFVDAGAAGPARAREHGPRGALSAQTLSGHESALSTQDLSTFFNTVVRALATQGFFGKRIHTVLDSTGEEVVPSFAGAGVVRKKVKVQQRVRRPKAMEVQVRGWKVWFLMEVQTGLPLAMTIAPIQTAEGAPVRDLVAQAKANLAGHAAIESVAVDRGFLDGDLLWWLEREQGIWWVCPSKENMAVTQEARERVRQRLSALAAQGESEIETAQRAAEQGLSGDGVSFFAVASKPGHDPLVLAQVDDLSCTEFYGEGGSDSSRVHCKKFRPTPLHGTVVLSWPDRSKHDLDDAQEHDDSGKGPLVLLSPLRQSGLFRFERYDARSLIENWLNRDGKQHFGLGATLARNEQAMWSATVFSTVALALYRALSIEREQSLDALDRRAEVLGVLRYRRQAEMKNRGNIMITVDDLYAVMPMSDFAAISGYQAG